jgi:type I restriction enzyme S subunit
MKRYDSYKDSGIEWIGEIPSHWETKRLKYFAKICNGQDHKAVNVENGKYPIYGSGGQFGTTDYYLYDQPSVLLGRKGTIDKPRHVDQPFWTVDTAYYTKVINDNNTKFFYYLCTTINFELYKYGSAIPSMTQGTLNDIVFCAPSFDEQTNIANYLDQKTNEIDNLIAKKEQLIQLLEEERIAIINQAVTVGLDPTVPMKDSGIEWLGEIPAHWELKRMRYLCDITTGGRDTENREDNGLYPFYVRSQTVERISSFSFDGEAILTAGDGVGVCKVWHYVNEKFDFHQRVYMMCNFQQVLGKYLYYYLKENFGKEVMKLSAKSTVDSLRRPMFQNFLVCFGSIDEQKQIVLKIEKEENRIQTIISKTQQDIQLLKEYKTALISEVVTGKVDVRKEK